MALRKGSLPLSTHQGSEADAREQDSQQPSSPSPLPASFSPCHFIGDSWSVQMCLQVLTHEVPRWGEGPVTSCVNQGLINQIPHLKHPGDLLGIVN